MGNGIGIAKDDSSGERQGVDNEELELNKKENADLSLNGDEVFELTVELIDSDNRVGNVELNGTSKTVDETSKLEGEIEKFGEETDAVQDSKDTFAKVEFPVSEKKPVYQDKSINGEQEIKPAADVSSSAKPETTPAGLGHTAPPLVPAPQNTTGNRETGSRSADNVPSAAPARPAGLGGAAPLLEPTSRVAKQPRVNGAISPTNNQLTDDNMNGEAEYDNETLEKLQMIRVKFLRLAHRLGQTPHNVFVAQVLWRLESAEKLRGRSESRVAAFSFDRASTMAEQLEATGQEPLDFTFTIMVFGKSGVGKSATMNSIFDEVVFGTDTFQMGTKKVQDIVGTVQGIRVRVIDTPGLSPSWSDQPQNEKILRSVKRFIKNTPPDIFLYLDRLDMQSTYIGEMPLLRTVTKIFEPSIWFNTIVVLTHAASAPPEGPNGTATNYDMFVTQRSQVIQQAIRQAAGDIRLMNPVCLVENHSACRTNKAGQRVLPNGQVWKSHLLLMSFAFKILAEANTLLKLQDSPPGRPVAPQKRSSYTLRSETSLSNHRINKAAAGFSATLLGDILTGGLKLEDKLMIGKLGQLVVSGGAIYGRGDVVCGGSLEATLKDKNHPLGRFLSAVGVSIMDCPGDFSIGCNSQTQIPIGRHTNLIGRFNINNWGSGQVSVRLNSSEQLQIILVGLIPVVKKFLGQGAVSYSG